MYTNVNDKIFMGNNIRFAEICQLTLDVCGLAALPEGALTSDGDKWVDLATAWDDLLTVGSAGIFTEAVHQIMWGIPSHRAVEKYDCIVQFVVKELLDDGEAFNSWDQLPACNMAIGLVEAEMNPWVENSEEYCYSIEHYQYLSNKMMQKVRYSKRMYADKVFTCEEKCNQYENAIKKLIPVAESWAETDWYKEKKIHDEIFKLHGVDYRDEYIDYGRILLILMNDNQDKTTYACTEAWLAANIERMPMSLAQVIWPKDTESEIMRVFLTATQLTEKYVALGSPMAYRKDKEIHPVDVFDYASLRKSWLYAQMYTWFTDLEGDIDCLKDVKKKLFEIAIKSNT